MGNSFDKFSSPGKTWSKLGRASRIRASTENSRSSQICKRCTEAPSKSSKMVQKSIEKRLVFLCFWGKMFENQRISTTFVENAWKTNCFAIVFVFRLGGQNKWQVRVTGQKNVKVGQNWSLSCSVGFVSVRAVAPGIPLTFLLSARAINRTLPYVNITYRYACTR